MELNKKVMNDLSLSSPCDKGNLWQALVIHLYAYICNWYTTTDVIQIYPILNVNTSFSSAGKFLWMITFHCSTSKHTKLCKIRKVYINFHLFKNHIKNSWMLTQPPIERESKNGKQSKSQHFYTIHLLSSVISLQATVS